MDLEDYFNKAIPSGTALISKDLKASDLIPGMLLVSKKTWLVNIIVDKVLSDHIYVRREDGLRDPFIIRDLIELMEDYEIPSYIEIDL